MSEIQITEYDLLDVTVDVLRALLWRNNNAQDLTGILEAKQQWYDDNHTQFWQNWFYNVFSLPNANDFGCSVWAIILGLDSNINVSNTNTTPFGFGSFNQNFNNSNFSPIETPAIALTTIEKRIILQLRYWQLVSKGRLVEDNSFLYNLFFPAAQVWYNGEFVPGWPGMPDVSGAHQWPMLVDNLNMTSSITLNPPISANLASVIIANDLLPRPGGVKLNITNNT